MLHLKAHKPRDRLRLTNNFQRNCANNFQEKNQKPIELQIHYQNVASRAKIHDQALRVSREMKEINESCLRIMEIAWKNIIFS